MVDWFATRNAVAGSKFVYKNEHPRSSKVVFLKKAIFILFSNFYGIIHMINKEKNRVSFYKIVIC